VASGSAEEVMTTETLRQTLLFCVPIRRRFKLSHAALFHPELRALFDEIAGE